MKKLIFLFMAMLSTCFAAQVDYKVVEVKIKKNARGEAFAIGIITMVTIDGQQSIQRGSVTKEEIQAYNDDPSTLKPVVERLFAENRHKFEKYMATPKPTVEAIDTSTIVVDKVKINETFSNLTNAVVAIPEIPTNLPIK